MCCLVILSREEVQFMDPEISNSINCARVKARVRVSVCVRIGSSVSARVGARVRVVDIPSRLHTQASSRPDPANWTRRSQTQRPRAYWRGAANNKAKPRGKESQKNGF